MQQYSKRHYISNVSNILSSYQNWGVDISSLLENIRKTDLEAYKAFLMLYKKDNGKFVNSINFKKASLFYERLYNLSLDNDSLKVDFRIEPLKKYLESYKYHATFEQNKCDHILSLLLLSEEFLFDSLSKNDNISSYGNNLYARSNDVEFYIKKDGNDKSCSQIIIPNEMMVTFNTKVRKLKK